MGPLQSNLPLPTKAPRNETLLDGLTAIWNAYEDEEIKTFISRRPDEKAMWEEYVRRRDSKDVPVGYSFLDYFQEVVGETAH